MDSSELWLRSAAVPQRVIFLLPRFLRDCLAFKNKILVDSFLKSGEHPAVLLEVGIK